MPLKKLLEATSNSASTLFAGGLLTVPMFQREYAWSKDQYQALWQDLREAIDEGPYFLGLVIITSAEGRAEIVDGQQRLITLSTLVAALRDECKRRRRESLAGQLHNPFLIALDYETDAEIERITLADPVDGEAFRHIVRGTVSSDDNHPLTALYHFFRRKLADDLGDDGFKRLGVWAEFLRESLYFAVFTHPDPNSAFTVFEVINDRGKRLTPADLLKNNLLMNVEPAQRVAVYDRWKAVENAFDEGPEDGFIEYIRHVAILRFGYVLPKDLYRKVSRAGDGGGMLQLLLDLEEHLEYYLQISDPETGGPASDRAASVFSHLNAIKVTAIRPLLLALGPAAEPEIIRTFTATVKVASVTSLGAANLEKRFSDSAVRARDSRSWTAPLDEVVPDRETFVDALSRRKLGRSLLLLLHRSIAQESPVPEAVGHLQLVRPRRAPSWNDEPDEQFANFVMTLGNTWLSEVARRPAGATTWRETIARLIKPYGDTWASDLKSLDAERWGSKDVRIRSRSLAQAAADVWY